MAPRLRKRSRGHDLRWIVAAAALLAAALCGAHRGHAVWTDITWAGDGFEIVHRLHLADAITVNRVMGGSEAIETLASRARVALYFEERFAVLVEGAPVALETIGAEIEDDFMLVYQEWSTPLPERFPATRNALLLDIEAHAQAFVRIEGPGLTEERER